MGGFKFNLGQKALIAVSGEVGNVVGRAEFLTSECLYVLRYATKDGQAREQWWAESALEYVLDPE